MRASGPAGQPGARSCGRPAGKPSPLDAWGRRPPPAGEAGEVKLAGAWGGEWAFAVGAEGIGRATDQRRDSGALLRTRVGWRPRVFVVTFLRRWSATSERGRGSNVCQARRGAGCEG